MSARNDDENVANINIYSLKPMPGDHALCEMIFDLHVDALFHPEWIVDDALSLRSFNFHDKNVLLIMAIAHKKF